MRHLQLLVRHTASLLAISALALIVVGCSKSVDTSTSASSVVATMPASAVSQPASKLGDLSKFRSIAADVAVMVNASKLPMAKTRIKDLELAWDSAEAGLKPRAAGDWHAIDKALDHALTALRADTPTQADCQKAISELLQTFDAPHR